MTHSGRQDWDQLFTAPPCAVGLNLLTVGRVEGCGLNMAETQDIQQSRGQACSTVQYAVCSTEVLV